MEVFLGEYLSNKIIMIHIYCIKTLDYISGF